ncbi:MAG TPA: hypothetical protein VFS21_30955 [Roseiflexaceae bacterium]|nr:hypothetical protein [Roseiflexaceae bacterium]
MRKQEGHVKLAGLTITVERSAYIAFGILSLLPVVVIAMYSVITRSPELTMSTAINLLWVGVGFAVYHQLGQLVHQLGHALAAHATGYPMTGIRYDAVFSYSEYPSDEPVLPARVHFQRSFGGLGGAIFLLVIALLLWSQADSIANWFTRWLVNFILFDSVMLFIGSVLSDGVLFVRERGWERAQTDG